MADMASHWIAPRWHLSDGRLKKFQNSHAAVAKLHNIAAGILF